MLYFAYGSNMNEAQMNERMVNTEWNKVGLYFLYDHRFAVTSWSRWSKSGYADALYCKHHFMIGVMYEVKHLREMDVFEGCRPANMCHNPLTGYKEKPSTYERVYLPPGFFSPLKGCYPAITSEVVMYVVRTPWTEFELPWNARYRSTVIQGAIAQDIPDYYVNQLREWPLTGQEDLKTPWRIYLNLRARFGNYLPDSYYREYAITKCSFSGDRITPIS